ncbi:SGNH/GDSL hydrolase family protein [Sphingomonas bisphenolicum]
MNYVRLYPYSAQFAALKDSLSPVALSGSYADLTGKPTLGSAAGQNIGAFASSTQGAKADTAVQSVAGKTGTAITLAKADVGLANVNNTADADKPVSGPQAAAIAAGDATEAVARDAAIANYVAPVIDEVSQRLRIDAKVLPTDMGGTMDRNTGYMSPADLKTFMARADRPMDARAIMLKPIIIDRDEKLGGGYAAYLPLEYIFVHAPILGLKQGYMPSNAASSELPGYVKFTFESAAPGVASTIYFDVVESAYDIATHPAQPDATGGYVPLLDVWGSVVSPYPGVNVIPYDDGILDPFSPIIGPDLFLTDLSRPVYLDNLFADREAVAPMVSLSSDAGYVAMQAGGKVDLSPSRIASSFSVRVVRQVQSAKLRTRSLTVHKRTTALSGTGKVLAIGDSITNRLTLDLIKNGIAAKGGTVVWVGTVNSSDDPDWPDWYGGPLGEGREGWSTRDYLGTDMSDGDAPLGVLPAGQEGFYLDGTKAAKLAYNPFLKALPSPSAAPTVVIGGTSYKFDMGYYLSRFNLATPDIVLLNLGMNDLFEDPTVFSANIGYIIAEIRRAMPSAKIVLWATTLPFGDEAYARYAAGWATILRTIVEKVTALRTAGDANIFLCSAWAHQDPVAGWKLTATGSEASGITDAELADYIHPYGIARQQHANALVDAVANLWPFNPEPPDGRRYWGVSSNGVLTAADVVALAGSDDATTRAKSFSVDAGTGAGQYVYYAYPASFGAPEIYKIFDFEEVYSELTVTITTVTGDRAYTVLRSINKLTGIVPVEVA